MNCDRCGERKAAVNLTRVVEGIPTFIKLCVPCFAESGQDPELVEASFRAREEQARALASRVAALSVEPARIELGVGGRYPFLRRLEISAVDERAQRLERIGCRFEIVGDAAAVEGGDVVGVRPGRVSVEFRYMRGDASVPDPRAAIDILVRA